MSPQQRVGVADSRTFERDVILATKPVLVDFWAPWCGPCQRQRIHLDEAAALLGATAKVFTFNVGDSAAIADVYGVQSIPSILLFIDGEVADAWSGVTTADEIVRRVRTAIA